MDPFRELVRRLAGAQKADFGLLRNQANNLLKASESHPSDAELIAGLDMFSAIKKLRATHSYTLGEARAAYDRARKGDSK